MLTSHMISVNKTAISDTLVLLISSLYPALALCMSCPQAAYKLYWLSDTTDTSYNTCSCVFVKEFQCPLQYFLDSEGFGAILKLSANQRAACSLPLFRGL